MLRTTIACVQMDCVLGDVEENLTRIRSFTRSARAEGADFVVVPECATTGYFLGDRVWEVAEAADGPTFAALAQLAREVEVHLAAGVIERDGDRVYDGLALFTPAGDMLALYRKVHLFGPERPTFASGETPVVVATPLGHVALTVCYDLIFPEYIRSLVDAGAEIVVNATNWIGDAWQASMGWSGQTVRSLASIRALENGVHVAMACRTGVEAGWTSLGHTTIASPTGAVLAGVDTGEGVAVAALEDPTESLDRWHEIATYRGDRRPELYGTTAA